MGLLTPGSLKGWKGYNTDIRVLKNLITSHYDLAYKALILGTGGAARATAYVLRRSGEWPTFYQGLSNEETLRYSDLDSHVVQSFY